MNKEIKLSVPEKCSFGDGIVIKPNGVDELDPCKYVVEEEYMNVTVRVLKCKNCGHVEIEWERQPNTVDGNGVVDLSTFPELDDYHCKVFTVPVHWLKRYLNENDLYQSEDGTGADLDSFLESYIWDETWFVYEQAVSEEMVLREEEQK